MSCWRNGLWKLNVSGPLVPRGFPPIPKEASSLIGNLFNNNKLFFFLQEKYCRTFLKDRKNHSTDQYQEVLHPSKVSNYEYLSNYKHKKITIRIWFIRTTCMFHIFSFHQQEVTFIPMSKISSNGHGFLAHALHVDICFKVWFWSAAD